MAQPSPCIAARTQADYGSLLHESMVSNPPAPLTAEEDLRLEYESDAEPETRAEAASSADAPKPAKRQKFSNARRRKRREEAKDPFRKQASEVTREKFVRPASSHQAPYDTGRVKVPLGAYIASKGGLPDDARYKFNLEELRERYPRMSYVAWDGSTPEVILDSQRRICVVLAGQPKGGSYKQATLQSFQAMGSSPCNTCRSKVKHQRGPFFAVNTGLCYGQGEQEPIFRNTSPHTPAIEELLQNPSIRQIASYASAAFEIWQPKVYQYYAKNLQMLYDKMPHLKHPIFDRSIFTTAAFNFGENVWCYKHRDVMNCPFGFCSVTALGQFDPTQGGHLVLWDLELIVEFPPGSTILLPSATITHSNIPVQEGDIRMSFTQYCPGEIFRYIENGFQTDKQLKQDDPECYQQRALAKEKRWEEGLALISIFDEL
ncbi:hypothetical protein AX14_006130 [Amanita brunnescens Koide BX004]|nr:hypothetical protein AX14_006130 [Amanita brunnescens Koide BX004]